MCLSIPMKIISIDIDRAVVEFNGVKKDISLKLLKDCKVNDYVLVHAGFAIGKMDIKSAEDALKVITEYEIA